jgi:predicted RNase H-like HicB family nuclease
MYIDEAMAKLTMKFEVGCSVVPDAASESFVSHCPELDLYSAGMTELEAMEAMRSALTLYIQSAIENKRLDAVLAQAGLQVTHSRQANEAPVRARLLDENVQMVPLEIPLYLLAAQSGYSAYSN